MVFKGARSNRARSSSLVSEASSMASSFSCGHSPRSTLARMTAPTRILRRVFTALLLPHYGETNSLRALYRHKRHIFLMKKACFFNTYRKIIKTSKDYDYNVIIIYIFTDNESVNVRRIKARVTKGEHNIPAADVIRRLKRSRNLFWKEYKDMANEWFLQH